MEKVDSDGVWTNNGAHYLLNRHCNINKVMLLLLGRVLHMLLVTKEYYLQLGIIEERKKGRPGFKDQKKRFRKISRVIQELY